MRKRSPKRQSTDTILDENFQNAKKRLLEKDAEIKSRSLINTQLTEKITHLQEALTLAEGRYSEERQQNIEFDQALGTFVKQAGYEELSRKRPRLAEETHCRIEVETPGNKTGKRTSKRRKQGVVR